jgi:hypothetical protein
MTLHKRLYEVEPLDYLANEHLYYTLLHATAQKDC